MPDDTKAFASARLAAPLYETIDEARETVAKAAKRLRGTSVARETNEIVREQHRVIGDWDTEVDLLKQSEELVRQRLMGK
jgi:cell shape-determining protein MreC